MRHQLGDEKFARPATEHLSPEGVPYRDYHAAAALASLPFGLGIVGAFELLSRAVVEEPIDLSDVPRDAILYLYHVESFLVTLTPTVWDGFGERLAYLGYHGFPSYLGGLWPYLHGFQCFRYDKRRTARPLAQIVEYLRANPDTRFALRTDAGGPYGKVRASLVDMALATGRPLVGMRQLADRSTRVLRHVVPLPGARIRTRLTAPISAARLKSLSRQDGRALLQQAIDDLD